MTGHFEICPSVLRSGSYTTIPLVKEPSSAEDLSAASLGGCLGEA